MVIPVKASLDSLDYMFGLVMYLLAILYIASLPRWSPQVSQLSTSLL